MRVLLFFFLLLAGSLAAQTEAYSYQRLEGTVGKVPVVFHLHQRQGVLYGEENPVNFSGVYYYTRFDAPISFYGSLINGKMVIYEQSMNGSPMFELKRVGTDRFTGVWVSADSTKQLPVELREVYPAGSVRFTGAGKSDQKLLFPAKKAGPKATTSAAWLVPGAGTDSRLTSFLLDQITLNMWADTNTARRCCRTPEEAYTHLRDSNFKEYPGEWINELNPDSIESDYSFMYNFDFDVSVSVYYNDNQRLALGFSNYAYTGGAHGNYGTSIVMLDAAKGRVLTINDFLKPGYEKTLQDALDRAARQRTGMKANAPLNEFYFVDRIPASKNFFATRTGLVFSYMPYEIASYAEGEIQLFVAFKELGQWVR